MSEIRLVSSETVSEIRKEVFTVEQGYPSDKLFDDKENTADFLAFIDEGRAVGCGRFFKENETDYHIDNIAFGKEMRGKGMGKNLVLALCEECKKTVPVVEKGVFGAHMHVSLMNDGPFTIILDSRDL